MRADGQKRHGAKSLGKAAQHVNAQGTRDTVNGAAAQGKFTFLSGETCFPCDMMLFPVKLPAGATGTKNVPAQMMEDSASFVRYETKMSRQETNFAASYGAICMIRRQESAEAIVAKCRE